MYCVPAQTLISPVRLLRYSTVNLIFFTPVPPFPLLSSPLLPKAAIPVSLQNQMAELAVVAAATAESSIRLTKPTQQLDQEEALAYVLHSIYSIRLAE